MTRGPGLRRRRGRRDGRHARYRPTHGGRASWARSPLRTRRGSPPTVPVTRTQVPGRISPRCPRRRRPSNESAPRLTRRLTASDRVAVRGAPFSAFAGRVRGRHDAESRHGPPPHARIVTPAHGLDIGDQVSTRPGRSSPDCAEFRAEGRAGCAGCTKPPTGLLESACPPIGRPWQAQPLPQTARKRAPSGQLVTAPHRDILSTSPP